MEHHTYLHISSAYTNQMPHLSHIIHHEYTRCRARHSRHLTLNSTPSNWELCTAQKKSGRRRRSFSPLDSIQTFTFIRLLCRYFVYKFKWVRHTTGNVIFTKKNLNTQKIIRPENETNRVDCESSLSRSFVSPRSSWPLLRCYQKSDRHFSQTGMNHVTWTNLRIDRLSARKKIIHD